MARPGIRPLVEYKSFPCQTASWKKARRLAAKVEHHQGELFPRVGFIVTNLQWIKEGKQAVKMAAAGVAEEDRELVADPACSSCW